MSLLSYADVWEGSEAKGSTLLVLLAIAEHYNPSKGYAWPSVETIADYARVSVRTVQDHLNKLEDLNELRIARGGGRKNPSRYFLNFKKLRAGRKSRNDHEFENPADFAPFNESKEPETPQNGAAISRETPQSGVINPAEWRRGSAGEGIGNRRRVKKREEEREKPAPVTPTPAKDSGSAGSLSLSDYPHVLLDRLAEIYPNAPRILSRVERKHLDEVIPLLSSLTSSDWLAFRVWTREIDKESRGCGLWPGNRSQFFQHAGEAIEKIKTWWEDHGQDWWMTRQALAERKARRQAMTDPDDSEQSETLTPAEALEFLKS